LIAPPFASEPSEPWGGVRYHRLLVDLALIVPWFSLLLLLFPTRWQVRSTSMFAGMVWTAHILIPSGFMVSAAVLAGAWVLIDPTDPLFDTIPGYCTGLLMVGWFAYVMSVFNSANGIRHHLPKGWESATPRERVALLNNDGRSTPNSPQSHPPHGEHGDGAPGVAQPVGDRESP
ncbi:MAG: hypothetical protein AAF612_11900, partial [Planctomycetota bacterium]